MSQYTSVTLCGYGCSQLHSLHSRVPTTKLLLTEYAMQADYFYTIMWAKFLTISKLLSYETEFKK